MHANTRSMHVARIERHYKGKTYVTILLRRSYREGKAVKHETLGNLSHLPERLIDMISDPDQEKASRTTKAFMAMGKFDIAALERAYAGE
mgnify:CR=1 FL=1